MEKENCKNFDDDFVFYFVLNDDNKIINISDNIENILDVRKKDIINRTFHEIFEVKNNNGFVNLLCKKNNINLSNLQEDVKKLDKFKLFLYKKDNNLIKLFNYIFEVIDKNLKENYNPLELFKEILVNIRNFLKSDASYILLFYNQNILKNEIIEEHLKEKFSLKKIKLNIENIKKIYNMKFLEKKEEINEFILNEEKDELENLLIIPFKGLKSILGYYLVWNIDENLKNEDILKKIAVVVNILSLVYEDIFLESKVDKENIMFKTLYNISQIINSTIDYDNLLDILTNIVSNLLNSHKIIILLFNRVNGILEIVRAKNIKEDKLSQYNNNPVHKTELNFDENNVENLQFLIENEKITELLKGFDFYILPMILRFKHIGYIVVEKDNFDELNIRLVKFIIDIAVKSLENAYLFKMILNQNDMLLKTTEMLKKTEQKLIASEKLAAVGKFASAVAHEIRNPLTIILSSVKNIKNSSDAEKEKLYKYIEEKIFEIEIVLKEMMNFAKEIKLSYSKFKPSDSIKELFDFLKEKITIQNIKTEILLNYLEFINADKMWFEKAILNLLINAIEEMKDGGILGLKLYEEGENIIIEISDTGKGISENIKDKIFEPFISFKKFGTGLGLYNVKKVIDMHGGEIKFTSSEKGTTFYLTIPKNLDNKII